MTRYKCKALSRTRIVELAKEFKVLFGLDRQIKIPVVELLDYFPTVFHCSYEVVEDSELQDGQHAVTDVINHVIKIRESVYLGACEGNGRDRMTIVHELAHYYLLIVKDFRRFLSKSSGEMEAYEDPEWQASALAAEIMIPCEILDKLSIEEIMDMCKVSHESANYQKNVHCCGCWCNEHNILIV